MARAPTARQKVEELLAGVRNGEARLLDVWEGIKAQKLRTGLTVLEACEQMPGLWSDYAKDAVGLVGLGPGAKLRDATRPQVLDIEALISSGCLFPKWPNFPWWPEPEEPM